MNNKVMETLDEALSASDDEVREGYIKVDTEYFR